MLKRQLSNGFCSGRWVRSRPGVLGRLEMWGTTIEHRAYTLPDKTNNVGPTACQSGPSATAEDLRALTHSEGALIARLLSEKLHWQRRAVSAALDDVGINVGREWRPAPRSLSWSACASAKTYPVEAELGDLDVVLVHVLLHVVDGRLDELEIYREDSGRLLKPAGASRGFELHGPVRGEPLSGQMIHDLSDPFVHIPLP